MSTTPNRSYNLPDGDNALDSDVLVLIAALMAIDADMQTALSAGAGFAALESPSFTGTPTAPNPDQSDDSVRIATTAFVQDVKEALQTALTALFAPKNNPTLTGTPSAPTPVPGTDTTQIATTAFVADALATAIAGLINSAPGALDTLNELAAALGDDPDFATTVTNAIAAKLSIADKASTALAQAGANDTQWMTPLKTKQAIAALADSTPPTTYGAVGTYVFGYLYGTGIAQGGTYAGSTIEPAGQHGAQISDDTGAAYNTTKGGGPLSGTWRAMGRVGLNSGVNSGRITLFVRIS